jgi:hypothetical protein
LKRDGVNTIFKEFKGAIHGFNALAGVAPKYAQETQEFLAKSVNDLMGR